MINNIPIIEYKQKEFFTIIYTGHDLEPEHNNSCINNPYMASIYQLLPDYYQPHFEQLLKQLNLAEYSDYFAYEWDRYLIPNPNAEVYVQFFMMVTFLKLYIDDHTDIHDAPAVMEQIINITNKHIQHTSINNDLSQDDLRTISKNIYNIMYSHYQNFLMIAE